ncbi:MAG: hypothetical protein H6708_06655 [Kofleriaceae bacterium]|nr:hypothetical protein [Kofleriaceae bacterium]
MPPGGDRAGRRHAHRDRGRRRAVAARARRRARATPPRPIDAAPPPPTPIDAAPPPPPVDAAVATGKPCERTTFDTKLVGDACARGGQAAAKAAMKQFVRDAKAHEPDLECGTCHKKLAPVYSLKPDGLDHFRKLGGS